MCPLLEERSLFVAEDVLIVDVGAVIEEELAGIPCDGLNPATEDQKKEKERKEKEGALHLFTSKGGKDECPYVKKNIPMREPFGNPSVT